MRSVKVVALVLVAMAVEGLLLVLWIASGAVVDKCNDGEDLVLCSDAVAQALMVAVIAFPPVALLAAVAVVGARRTREHRDSD